MILIDGEQAVYHDIAEHPLAAELQQPGVRVDRDGSSTAKFSERVPCKSRSLQG